MVDLSQIPEMLSKISTISSSFKSAIYSIVGLLPVAENYVPLLSILIWVIFLCLFIKTTIETGKYIVLVLFVFFILMGMNLLG